MKMIRIQMAVSETNEDGSAGRYITIDQEIPETDAKAWFYRTGDGVGQIFDLSTSCLARFTKKAYEDDAKRRTQNTGNYYNQPGFFNKIESIKAYREVTGCGLKEAKDAVEDLESRGSVWCRTHEIATKVARVLQQAGGLHTEVVKCGEINTVKFPTCNIFSADDKHVSKLR